jgi:hypothetical protein
MEKKPGSRLVGRCIAEVEGRRDWISLRDAVRARLGEHGILLGLLDPLPRRRDPLDPLLRAAAGGGAARLELRGPEDIRHPLLDRDK